MLNLGQISYESFFCRPNGSQLKLSPKIAQLNFSYFAKIPPWLEIGGAEKSAARKGLNYTEFSAELVRSKNTFFQEFKGYYATKCVIQITTWLEKKNS